MDIHGVNTIYFLGIGGIGMSALARYFMAKGYRVLGYDRTVSPLTLELEKEGIDVEYGDDCTRVRELNIDTTLVVRTPAVPEEQAQYVYLRENGFRVMKRAEVLGWLTLMSKSLCVAGTHGKTTTSTMLAHIMYSAKASCSAFMGGISNNYNTNLLIDTQSDYVVVEADEYDRSFHHLRPYISVITSMDPDHLDIYGTEQNYYDGFAHYASLVTEALVVKKGLSLDSAVLQARLYTYAVEEDADFAAMNVRYDQSVIVFDFYAQGVVYEGMRLTVPVWVNVENSVAALAVGYLLGLTEEELRHGLETFAGVYRRFNMHINTPRVSYIDDYAHHPEELRASIESVRRLYPERRTLVVFQPHLFSRTQDFAQDFAQVLGTADALLLLPIYPARELPIEGVTSDWLLSLVPHSACQAQVVEKPQLVAQVKAIVEQWISNGESCVVMTLGAGDIDRLVQDVKLNLNIYE
ncbi:MAG: UDP-N-acetylmuramate--L-alanine ligase [Paludibacteraceae bacterium]|nr:UDP-N-acetylmuramate--L-alanine ligase [Paludibacteraceae bacterium]